MNELFLEQSPKTPQIDLNQYTGELIFFGKSIPENASKVYEPVLKWISEYIHEARPITNLRLNLEYYNTSSSIWFTKIFKMLLQIKDPDYVIIVHLYLPLEDFDEMDDFDDIKDAFIPIANIDNNALPGIGIRIYCTNETGEIVKEKLVFIEKEQLIN